MFREIAFGLVLVVLVKGYLEPAYTHNILTVHNKGRPFIHCIWILMCEVPFIIIFEDRVKCFRLQANSKVQRLLFHCSFKVMFLFYTFYKKKNQN